MFYDVTSHMWKSSCAQTKNPSSGQTSNEYALKPLFLPGKADATTLGIHRDQEGADALFARTLKAVEAK